MATIDNMGREINSSMGINDIKDLIGSLMNDKVGKPKPVSRNAENETNNNKNQTVLSDLKTLFEQYTKDFMSEIESQKSFLKEVVSNLKSFIGLRQERAKTKESTSSAKVAEKGKVFISKEDKATAKASKSLALEFHRTLGTKGSGWVHDIHCEKVLNQILAALTNEPAARSAAVNAAGAAGDSALRQAEQDRENRRSRTGTDTAKPGVGRDRQTNRNVGGWMQIGAKGDLDDLYFMQNVISNINQMSNTLQKNFLGFNGFDAIVKGISDEERKFTQEVRATAYEIAGVTKESMNLQKVYEQIGKVTSETGMDRSESQKFYLKALKSGIKDTKIALGVVKSQLNTERQLGLEAGSLNESFMSMSHSGRMNNVQIAEMGRGMREVARNTGITGESLVSAIKGGEEFTNNLRKAAQLTAESVQNITEISAISQKLGIAGEMQQLMAAMSSTNTLLFQSSRGIQSLLLQAAGSVGKTESLINGTMLRSKQGIDDMARGFDNVLKQFGVESLEAVDNLSDAAKMQLNIQLKAAFGIELGDMRSVIETFQESGKGMGVRLAEINKQLKLNLTTEEKAALAEKERVLRSAKSMSVLTALSEATKGTEDGIGGMNKAFEKFNRRKIDFEADMNAMGQTWTNGTDAARQSIQSALKQINTGREKAGLQTIKIDSSDIESALKDKTALTAVVDRLNKGEQELATANKDQLDPMTRMEGYLKSINENIRIYTQSMFSMMFNSILGQLVAIAGVLASIAVGLGYMGLNISNTFSSIKSLGLDIIPRLLGNANEVATEVAEDVASATVSAVDDVAAAITTGVANANPAVAAATNVNQSRFTRARAAVESFSTRFSTAMDSWAANIGTNTEILARQVETNPFGTFTRIVRDSWAETTRIVSNATTNITATATRGFNAAADIASRGFTRITDGATYAFNGVRQIPSLLRGIPQTLRDIPQLTNSAMAAVTRGVGNGSGAIIKASGKMGSSLLRVAARMNPFTLAFMAIFAAVDGLTGSMKAAARAGETFGKSQEDLTLNEEYAAKSAGLLIGILNGLTFGIAGLILPLEKITDWFARFNAKIPIFTIVLAPVVMALEFLWGAIKGIGLAIWEIVKGIYDGVSNILNPLIDGLSNIFGALGKVFTGSSEKASGLTRVFRELGGIIGIVSGAIKGIGLAIGWIFRLAGSLIGFIVKSVLNLVEGFLVVLNPIEEIFSAIWSGIGDVATGFYDIYKSILDVVSIGAKVIYDLFSPIFAIFSGEGKGFAEIFKYIGKAIGGFFGILIKFVAQPLMLVAKLVSGIGKMIQAVVKIFTGDFSGATELVKSTMSGIIGALIWPIKDLLNIFGGFGDKLTHVFDGAYDYIGGLASSWLEMTKIIFSPFIELKDAIWSAIKDVGVGVYDAISGIGEAFIPILSEVKNVLIEVGGIITDLLEPLFGSNIKKSNLFITLKMIMKATGYITAFLIKLVLHPLMMVAKYLSAIGKTIQAIVKIFKGDFIGAKQLIFDAINGIIDGFLWPIKGAEKFLIDWGRKLFGLVTGAFSNCLGLVGSTVNDIKDWFYELWHWLVGGSLVPDLVNDIISWFSKLPGGIFESLIALPTTIMSGLGTWIYDTFTTAFKKVADYVIGLVPGVKSFAATEQENQKRVNLEGNSVSGGIGRTLGGISELSIEKTAGGLGELGNVMLDAVDPFNWFEEGTRKVQQTGIGILHKNEMVIPAKDVENITAKGNGKFQNNSLLRGNISEKRTVLNEGNLEDKFKLNKNEFTIENRWNEANIGPKTQSWAGPEIKQQVTNTAENVTMPGVIKSDVEQELQKRTATIQPTTTEIVSPDLGDLKSDSTEQTVLMSQMVELLKKFIDLAKPKSSVTSSESGNYSQTGSKKGNQKPANYYRAPIGHVSQTAAKAVLNVGASNT